MKIRPDSTPPPGPPADDADDRVPLYQRPWFAGLVLAVLTFGVFQQVTSYPFVEFDDQDYVVSNPHVQGGLSGADLAWAFTSTHASNWHPITWISHMLDVQLFGQNAAGPHLVNLLWHIANALLLLSFLRKATGQNWPSAFAAALFALHPLHVESVAWVAERKDVLSTCFALLTLHAYLDYTRARAPGGAAPGRPARFHYGLALFWFALGLMSKPMLVSLPLLLLLVDYWPLGRFSKGAAAARVLLWEKLPFVALSALSCGMTLFAQYHGGAVQDFAHLPVQARVANALVSFSRYLGKTVLPLHLSILYPYPGNWPWVSVLLSALLLVAVSAAAVCLRRRFPALVVGWFWFVISLLPVIGLVQVGEQSMADRYMYIPSIGLFAAIAWLGAAAAARLALAPSAVGGIAGVLLAGCAARTMVQVPYWRDTESLYLHALATGGPNPTVVRFLAYHYYNLGNAAKEAGNAEEAIVRYRGSLKMDPQNSLAHNNLGMVYQAIGRIRDAIPEYGKAVELSPTNAHARNNLGVALAAGGNLEEAAKQLVESARLAPDNAEAHNNLGALYFRQGKFKEAVPEYEAAARLAPGNPGVLDNLGDALARLGRPEEAQSAYRKALGIDPGDPVAQKRLGIGPAATKPPRRAP